MLLQQLRQRRRIRLQDIVVLLEHMGFVSRWVFPKIKIFYFNLKNKINFCFTLRILNVYLRVSNAPWRISQVPLYFSKFKRIETKDEHCGWSCRWLQIILRVWAPVSRIGATTWMDRKKEKKKKNVIPP
jgi:hypothetical protein